MKIKDELLVRYKSLDLVRIPKSKIDENDHLITYSKYIDKAIQFCLSSGIEINNIPSFTFIDIFRNSLPKHLLKIIQKFSIKIHYNDEIESLKEKSIFAFIPAQQIYKNYSMNSLFLTLWYHGIYRFKYNDTATNMLYKIKKLSEEILTSEKCLKIFSKLEDIESKNCFLRVLKSRIENNPGYLELSHYPQYEHPFVHVKNGDNVVEGGILDGISTEIFANQTGNFGSVTGFEAFPKFAEESANYLSIYPWVSIKPYGLSSENKIMYVYEGSHPGGTHISNIKQDSGVKIQTVSLDNFLNFNKYYNLLKLDIEGSEMDCLYGSKKFIEKYLPNLQISIYHKFDDILNIPFYIINNFNNYKLFIGHHFFYFNETVLYATTSYTNRKKTHKTSVVNFNNKDVIFVGAGTAYFCLKHLYSHCRVQAFAIDKEYINIDLQQIDGIPVKFFDQLSDREKQLPFILFATHGNEFAFYRRICHKFHIPAQNIHMCILYPSSSEVTNISFSHMSTQNF